jgi:hypothetical protein
MMGRVTLREVRKALAEARAKRAKGSATSPTVQELESMARALARQLTPKPTVSRAADTPPEEASVKADAKQGAAADGRGHRGGRRSARSRSPRRR